MSQRAPAHLAQRPASGAPVGATSRPHELTTARASRIGILAGGGRLPLTIAESVIEHGGSVHIVAIEGEADQAIARFPHTWVNWGHVGRMVTTLRRHGGTMVIAGSVRRPNLWKLRPDLGFLLSLPQILEMMAGGGDDSVLSRVVRFFEAKGIEVRGAHEVAPDLLASAGPAGALALDAGAQADAELGFAVRSALGPLDAGQAVVVADGKVLAIEGAEGTDPMLARAGSLRDARTGAARSGVLTKGPKPGQELRVDMPAIGPRTVEGVAAAGLAGVVVEAGAVLLLDRGEAVAAADARGIAIEGLPRTPALSSLGGSIAPTPAEQLRLEIERGAHRSVPSPLVGEGQD
ncbi:MAG: UDP-2,3-diacylglucosamine diphosphatase LpxI, partial [Hyphomicrobiaceae bacterium]